MWIVQRTVQQFLHTLILSKQCHVGIQTYRDLINICFIAIVHYLLWCNLIYFLEFKLLPSQLCKVLEIKRNVKCAEPYNTFNHTPRIRTASDSPAFDFNKNVTADHSKGNTILQRTEHIIDQSDLKLMTNNRRERIQSLNGGLELTRYVTILAHDLKKSMNTLLTFRS